MNKLILAADIGGSHISSTVIDTDHWQIVEENIHKSHIDGFASKEAILEVWCNNLKESIRSKMIDRIAIAMPGPFDYEKGVFEQHPEGKFGSLVNVNFKTEIQKRLGQSIKIHFENDAAAFGIGESYFGQSKKSQRSIAITLGTGIGATFITHHRAIKEGKNIPAGGELYHQKFRDSIADDYFSTRWFVQQTKEKYKLEIGGVKELIETKQEEAIQHLFTIFTASLHEFLLPYAQKNEVEVIVIGGNIAKAWEYFGDQLSVLFQANAIRVLPSILQEKAILLGAAKSFNT